MANDMLLDKSLNLLNSQGYCVLEDVIDDDSIDQLYTSMVTCGITRIDGMLNEIPQLSEICDNPRILEILYALLGDDICLANALSIKSSAPGFPGGSLHTDLDAIQLSKCDSLPIWHTIQVLWAFNDTTVDNGATRVVPFSHLTRSDPIEYGYGHEGEECPHEIVVPVKRGTAIILHAALWHRGGPNTTTDQPRYLVSGYFHLPRLYDEVISCLGFWPAIKPNVFERLSPVVQNMVAFGLESGRGGRKGDETIQKSV